MQYSNLMQFFENVMKNNKLKIICDCCRQRIFSETVYDSVGHVLETQTLGGKNIVAKNKKIMTNLDVLSDSIILRIRRTLKTTRKPETILFVKRFIFGMIPLDVL
jgi:hypothetical protein